MGVKHLFVLVSSLYVKGQRLPGGFTKFLARAEKDSKAKATLLGMVGGTGTVISKVQVELWRVDAKLWAKTNSESPIVTIAAGSWKEVEPFWLEKTREATGIDSEEDDEGDVGEKSFKDRVAQARGEMKTKKPGDL